MLMKVELSGILRGAASGASFVELEGQTIKALMDDLLRRYPQMAGPMEEGIAAHVRETQMELKASVDALSRSFAELHAGLREEREQRRVDVEHLAQSVVARVDECQASVDDERVQRLEREAATLKRVGEDVIRLQEKVDGERGVREAAMAELGTIIDAVVRRQETHDDKFQTVVLTEIAAIKGALNAEKEERVAEDEQIVHAINDYTRALQDGLRIVNQS